MAHETKECRWCHGTEWAWDDEDEVADETSTKGTPREDFCCPEHFALYALRVGHHTCALPGCDRLVNLAGALVHDYCSLQHRETHRRSADRPCLLAGCGLNVGVDRRTGAPFDFCCRAHGVLWRAVRREGFVLRTEGPRCRLRGCGLCAGADGLLLAPDYCCAEHAALDGQPVVRVCKLSGCSNVVKDPRYDCCCIDHSRRWLQQRAQAERSSASTVCALPGCGRPVRDALFGYCSNEHAVEHQKTDLAARTNELCFSISSDLDVPLPRNELLVILAEAQFDREKALEMARVRGSRRKQRLLSFYSDLAPLVSMSDIEAILERNRWDTSSSVLVFEVRQAQEAAASEREMKAREAELQRQIAEDQAKLRAQIDEQRQREMQQLMSGPNASFDSVAASGRLDQGLQQSILEVSAVETGTAMFPDLHRGDVQREMAAAQWNPEVAIPRLMLISTAHSMQDVADRALSMHPSVPRAVIEAIVDDECSKNPVDPLQAVLDRIVEDLLRSSRPQQQPPQQQQQQQQQFVPPPISQPQHFMPPPVSQPVPPPPLPQQPFYVAPPLAPPTQQPEAPKPQPVLPPKPLPVPPPKPAALGPPAPSATPQKPPSPMIPRHSDAAVPSPTAVPRKPPSPPRRPPSPTQAGSVAARAGVFAAAAQQQTAVPAQRQSPAPVPGDVASRIAAFRQKASQIATAHLTQAAQGTAGSAGAMKAVRQTMVETAEERQRRWNAKRIEAMQLASQQTKEQKEARQKAVIRQAEMQAIMRDTALTAEERQRKLDELLVES